MSSNLIYDSDDERDKFDIEQRRIDIFQKNFLSASIESSEDDDEGIIDGTKIPSSTKLKSRARHAFLDISILSSSPSSTSIQEEDDDEQNPFDIISKSIHMDNIKPIKKKKSLGVPKSRVILDTTDIYDQDDSRDSFTNNYSKVFFFLLLKKKFFLDNKLDEDEQSSTTKSNNKVRSRQSERSARRIIRR
jgi:hypothetical protein